MTEQTENPKEIPSVPSFPFVPYSLIPFMIAILRLSAELPGKIFSKFAFEICFRCFLLLSDSKNLFTFAFDQ
jgi:hypothetical protein